MPSRREPDIFFIASRNLDIVQKSYVAGPPELVLEIVAPSSNDRDYRVKFREYEESGIPEYWIIDPSKNSVYVYALNSKGRYEIRPVKDGKFASKIVPGFYLRQEWLDNIESVRLFDVLKEMGAI